MKIQLLRLCTFAIADSTAVVLGSPRPPEDDDLESIQMTVEELSDDDMSIADDGDPSRDAKDEARPREPMRSEGSRDPFILAYNPWQYSPPRPPDCYSVPSSGS